jgi:hypothetical protein
VRPLTREELVDNETYEALRPAFREAVIAVKRARRVGVGEHVTLVFENRETIRFQVQEMLRVEHTSEPEAVQQELDVYNELVPGERELSATLFIEITDMARIKAELDRLIGIDEHVFLILGEDETEERIQAHFDRKQMEEDRIAAVQYVRFPLSETQVAQLRDASLRARLRIDHPAYHHEAEVSPPLRANLIADLAGDPEPLLCAPAGTLRAPEPSGVLAETPTARALRPPRPEVRGQVVVEPRDPSLSLLEAEPAQLLEILALVQRFARELHEEYGGCRVRVDTDARPPRWHLLPRRR